MIRPVLRIILQYKDDALLPNRALTEIFNEFSDSQIVIGYMGEWGQLSPAQTFRMIIPKPDGIKAGRAPAASRESKSAFHWVHLPYP